MNLRCVKYNFGCKRRAISWTSMLCLCLLNHHLCQHIVIKPFEPYVVFVVTVGVFFYLSKVFLSLFKEHGITQQLTVICDASQVSFKCVVWFPWLQTFQTVLIMDAYAPLTYLFPRESYRWFELVLRLLSHVECTLKHFNEQHKNSQELKSLALLWVLIT